jgi:hypothetical protein
MIANSASMSGVASSAINASPFCVLLDPLKDACAIDHGAIRAGYPQNLVMVAVEVSGAKESGFPAVESPGGQFAAADSIDVDHVPLFFHWASRAVSAIVKGYVRGWPAGKANSD